MDYKGYHIEEEKPGEFMIYRSYEDWRDSKEPVYVATSLSEAEQWVDNVPHILSEEFLPPDLPDWAKEKFLYLGISELKPVKDFMKENFPFQTSNGHIVAYHITRSSLIPHILKEGLRPVGTTAIHAVYLAWDAEQASWLLPPTIFGELSEGERLETLVVHLPLDWPILPDPEETDIDEASGKLNIPVIMSFLPIPPKYVSRESR